MVPPGSCIHRDGQGRCCRAAKERGPRSHCTPPTPARLDEHQPLVQCRGAEGRGEWGRSGSRERAHSTNGKKYREWGRWIND